MAPAGGLNPSGAHLQTPALVDTPRGNGLERVRLARWRGRRERLRCHVPDATAR